MPRFIPKSDKSSLNRLKVIKELTNFHIHVCILLYCLQIREYLRTKTANYLLVSTHYKWTPQPVTETMYVMRDVQENNTSLLLLLSYLKSALAMPMEIPRVTASVAEWLRCLALKLLAPLCWDSNPMRGSYQLLTDGCWFTPRNNVFLQLWKLTAIHNQTWLKIGVKHQFTSLHPRVPSSGRARARDGVYVAWRQTRDKHT